ncbi:MAG: alpha/beta fold hydrolase [Candidatus Omnitrophica bacterium]|nr:alpha/beta fold hydrolase [Candidatus Omnitrophota bacterium]
MENNGSKKFNFYLKGSNEKAVLLIHGITGTPSEMKYYGTGLNKAGYTVFCNTLPKHCSSLGELKQVKWQDMVDCCIDDLKNLRKDYKKVYISGLSMGALIGIHLAYLFPDDVSGIVALAPTIFYDGWALHKGKVFLNLAFLIPFLRNSIDIREDWPYGLKDEDSREAIERFYKNAKSSEFSKKTLLFGSPFFPVACLYQHHLFTKIVVRELNKVKTPIVAIHSSEDDMVSIRNAQYILERIGSSFKSLVPLEDSYHMITIDKQKDKVIQESVSFMDKI